MSVSSPASGGIGKDASAGDRYSIVRKLGEGGMGVVYEAVDRQRGTRVALKEMRLLSPAALYRFKQEFRAIADVSHPNLVSLFDLVTDDERAFFTMELVDGTTFTEHVRGQAPSSLPFDRTLEDAAREASTLAARSAATSRPCDVTRLRPALVQLANAVSALHDHGKIHRDLKPSNVLVATDGRVVVLDFGLALDLTKTNVSTFGDRVVGTVEYMSPEQAASRELTEASDWYSVGVMLFEALTGKLPIEGPPLRLLIDKQRVDVPAPSTLADVPPDLDALCRELLEHDPKKRPTGAEVIRRLGATSTRTAVAMRSTVRSGGAPFVGREAHMAQLRDAFKSSCEGKTVLLRVFGSSGMGKSALVQRFADEITEESGAVVLVGRCYERESLSFKAFDSIVDALTRYLRSLPSQKVGALLPRDVPLLARVFPVLARVEDIAVYPRRAIEIADPAELRRKAFSALRELVIRLTDRVPLVMWLDDVQWGDTDSAALLAELVRPPYPPPFLLVLSYRAEEAQASPLLGVLRERHAQDLGEMETREIEVGRLEETDAARLAASLLGESGAIARQIASESQGSPYFVDELVRYVGAGRGLGVEVPLRLDDALKRRMDELPEDAAKLLRFVAVAGGPIAEDLLIRAAEVPDHLARKALALLRAEHLARGARGGAALDTFHDRVRETLVAHIDAETAKQVHHRLAGVLLATGTADPDALVEHFRAAGDREHEAEFAVAAAEKAERALAFERAVALYERAIALDVSTEERVRVLRAKLADALRNAGRWTLAAEQRLFLAEGTTSEQSIALRGQAAELLLCSGHFDRGHALLDDVLRSLKVFVPRAPVTILIAVLVVRALLRLRGLKYALRPESSIEPRELARVDALISAGYGLAMNDNVRANYFMAYGALLALRLGELHRIVAVLAMTTGMFAATAKHGHAFTATLLRATDAAAVSARTPLARAMAFQARAWTEYMSGDLAHAKRSLIAAETIYREECIGATWLLSTTRAILARTLAFRGDLADLDARLTPWLREADAIGDVYAATNLRAGALVWLKLASDQPHLATEALAWAEARLPRTSYLVQHYFHAHARATVALYEGRAAEAFAHSKEASQKLRRSLLTRIAMVRVLAVDVHGRSALAAAAMSSATRPALLAHAERMASALEHEHMDLAEGFAAVLRAGIAKVRAKDDEAVAHAERAIATFERLEMPIPAAAVRWVVGRHVGGERGAGETSQAAAVLDAQGVRSPARFVATIAPGWPLNDTSALG